MANDGSAVVLFDGECNLCSGLVNFLLAKDRQQRLRFASLQSEAAHRLLADRLGEHSVDADTVVFLSGDEIFLRSDAALRIASVLPWPWRAVAVLSVIPRPVRDVGYRWVARNRKRMFRKKVECRLPTADERRRFL